jgi:hypothetical protein
MEDNEEKSLQNINTNLNYNTNIDIAQEKLHQTDYSNLFIFKKLGNCWGFVFINDHPIFLIGPNCNIIFTKVHFFFGLLIVVPSILFLYMYFLRFETSFFMKVVIYCLYICHFISYSFISLVNPGVQLKNIKSTEGKKYKYCGKCFLISLTENRVEHCSICNLCYLKRHHHCLWATKCIGDKNMVFFFIFISSTLLFILSLYIGIYLFLKKNW